jgi:DNA-binding response OmpR family regulator
VDILISRLRAKLQPLDCIKTNWGAGYSFISPES